MKQLPRAMLVDLDDTIIDDSGCVDGCWADACADAAARLACETEVLQKAIREYAAWWWSDRERSRRGRLDLRAATAHIVHEAMRRIGREDRDEAALIANLYRDLREQRADLFEGAIETLERLRSNGVRLGLMTNGAGPSQRAKIERFALAHHFEHIVIEGEFGCGKPDRRVYESLLSALECSPSEAWAVGDNLEADVLGAMSLGLRGVWIDRSGSGVPAGSPQPDRVIARFAEIA